MLNSFCLSFPFLRTHTASHANSSKSLNIDTFKMQTQKSFSNASNLLLMPTSLDVVRNCQCTDVHKQNDTRNYFSESKERCDLFAENRKKLRRHLMRKRKSARAKQLKSNFKRKCRIYQKV